MELCSERTTASATAPVSQWCRDTEEWSSVHVRQRSGSFNAFYVVTGTLAMDAAVVGIQLAALFVAGDISRGVGVWSAGALFAVGLALAPVIAGAAFGAFAQPSRREALVATAGAALAYAALVAAATIVSGVWDDRDAADMSHLAAPVGLAALVGFAGLTGVGCALGVALSRLRGA
jgi:hypothetical protein